MEVRRQKSEEFRRSALCTTSDFFLLRLIEDFARISEYIFEDPTLKFIMVSYLMHAKQNIQAAGLSDIGLVRQNNEDVWSMLTEFHCYVLADGMGGHQAGEIAAREAVNTLCQLVKKSFGHSKHSKSLQDSCAVLEHTIEMVNTVVFRMGRQYPELYGMGTTLCCLQVLSDGVIIAHVGDSRIYRIRQGHIELMTKDHSLLSELVELGQISEQNTAEFMYKNILTKAIGTEPYVEPTVVSSEIRSGDIYLLCTDGLSDMLSQKEIEQLINTHGSIDGAAKALVDHANDKGGLDNITVLLVKIEEADAAKDLPR